MESFNSLTVANIKGIKEEVIIEILVEMQQEEHVHIF